MGRPIIAVIAPVWPGDDIGSVLIPPFGYRTMSKEKSVMADYGDIANLDVFNGARFDMQCVAGLNAGIHA